jgi:hypothetical protein
METNDQIDIKDEDTKEEDFSEAELADETIDWKAKAAELKGIAKRRATQLAKAKEKLAGAKVEPKPSPTAKPEFEDFDDGQYAYLTAKGIEDDGEIAIVKTAVKESGRSLRDVLKMKYLQEELKEYREAKATKEATPTGTNRSPGGAATSKVDFWLAKGEMPPNTPENYQLRRDVVNAKLKRLENANKFTDNAVGNVNG